MYDQWRIYCFYKNPNLAKWHFRQKISTKTAFFGQIIWPENRKFVRILVRMTFSSYTFHMHKIQFSKNRPRYVVGPTNEVVAFEKEPRNIYVTKWKAFRSALPIFRPAAVCLRQLLPEGFKEKNSTPSAGRVYIPTHLDLLILDHYPMFYYRIQPFE